MTFSGPVINQSACGIYLSHLINDKYNILFNFVLHYIVFFIILLRFVFIFLCVYYFCITLLSCVSVS